MTGINAPNPAATAVRTPQLIREHPCAAELTARRLSVALAIVSTAAALPSFYFWSLFHRDTPATVGNMRGTALTVLIVALPALMLSMHFASRGSLRARLIWAGTLAYLAYNAVMFIFSTHFNSLFLVYTTMLGLSFWALLTFARALDTEDVQLRMQRVPARAVALYLIASTAAFSGLWLATVVPASLTNEMPGAIADAGLLQNTVWVLDFAFTFPLMLLGAVWIWRRTAWGYVVAATMVIMLTIETASIAVDQLFGHLHDPGAPLDAVAPMVFFTAAGLVFSTLLLSRVTQASPVSAGQGAARSSGGFPHPAPSISPARRG